MRATRNAFTSRSLSTCCHAPADHEYFEGGCSQCLCTACGAPCDLYDRLAVLDAACRAFHLKEAELMGWTTAEAEARFGLYREEIAAAVVAALKTLAEEL